MQEYAASLFRTPVLFYNFGQWGDSLELRDFDNDVVPSVYKKVPSSSFLLSPVSSPRILGITQPCEKSPVHQLNKLTFIAWPRVNFVATMPYVGGLGFALGIPLVEMGVQLNTFWCLTSPLLSFKAKNMGSAEIQVATVILVPHFAFCVPWLRSYWAHKSFLMIHFEIYIVRDYSALHGRLVDL